MDFCFDSYGSVTGGDFKETLFQLWLWSCTLSSLHIVNQSKISLLEMFACGYPVSESYSSVSQKTRCLPIYSHSRPSPALRLAFLTGQLHTLASRKPFSYSFLTWTSVLNITFLLQCYRGNTLKETCWRSSWRGKVESTYGGGEVTEMQQGTPPPSHSGNSQCAICQLKTPQTQSWLLLSDTLSPPFTNYKLRKDVPL